MDKIHPKCNTFIQLALYLADNRSGFSRILFTSTDSGKILSFLRYRIISSAGDLTWSPQAEDGLTGVLFLIELCRNQSKSLPLTETFSASIKTY